MLKIKKLMINDKKLLTKVKSGYIIALQVNFVEHVNLAQVIKKNLYEWLNNQGGKIMENQEIILQKIKKNSKATSVVISIAMIICIVAATLTSVSSVVILTNMSAFEKNFEDIDMDLHLTPAPTMESSVPAIQEYFDTHYYPITYSVLGQLLVGTVTLIVAIIVLAIFKKIFKIISDNDTPFTPEILKYFRFSFIALAIVVVFSTGVLPGAIAGLLLYCIYNIFSYGCELQKLSDETL